MFDFSGLQDRYGDAIGQGRLHYGSSLAARVSSALSANDGDHTLRRPLRISRIIVLKTLGPHLIPFTQAAFIYFILFFPHDAISLSACFIKCLPILSLCSFVILRGDLFYSAPTSSPWGPQTRYSRLILAGLMFSGLGDALLQFASLGYFLPGMAAFGAAHVCYIMAFGCKPVNLVSGGFIYGVAGGCFYQLMPYLSGVFTYAVGVYFFLVSTMAWRAVARVPFLNDLWTWTKLGAAVGSCLFCFSDLLVATKTFCGDFPFSQFLIMTTYYAAQMGIAVSVAEGQLRPSESRSSSTLARAALH